MDVLVAVCFELEISIDNLNSLNWTFVDLDSIPQNLDVWPWNFS